MPTPNYGLLPEVAIDPRDWRAGGISGVKKTVLREDGDYSSFLPTDEYQSGLFFETFACVSFSALNCLETISRVQGRQPEWSDRALAKWSNTTKQGNFLSTVAETIRNSGVVDEILWPFPRFQRDPPFLFEDYYCPTPNDLIALGQAWKDKWEVLHEWVQTDSQSLVEALKYGPIQVTVRAWPAPVDGVYQDDPSVSLNHAVMLYKADGTNWFIFDHYDSTKKKLVWNYGFGAAKQFFLSKKTPMPALELPNDTLVQDVQRHGTFGNYLNGKIMQVNALGDEGKLALTMLMRGKTVLLNGEEVVVQRKAHPLTKEQWDSVSHVDLKGNPLT